MARNRKSARSCRHRRPRVRHRHGHSPWARPHDDRIERRARTDGAKDRGDVTRRTECTANASWSKHERHDGGRFNVAEWLQCSRRT